jgi:hypothetical protein
MPLAAQVVIDHCAKNNYRLFNGLETFAESEVEPDLLYGRNHPSPLGARLFGEAFAEYVKKEKP